ncbi:MAG: chromosome segregation protein [Bacteroidota bacterium]|nr:chromosome segregation protein [Bacteroidota bacterium]
MYLSKLEIFGFKSFATKTTFRFNDGLTAIVGPNGCGKTNVVDAIRWALGEQKTSVLRSDLMENVIFNGAGNRKPLSMSEVTLTLENNKNILPLEYSEVSITRRLFRDGESVYMLNKTPCRLRDILDLFMDTGMGPDSYSVIELKMVEAILSGKAEERRHLVEEAAGVNKFKLRKKEADKKLANVQNDLTRLDDIVQEIRKNVNSLARQATRTRKYNDLVSKLTELETELIKCEYAISMTESDKSSTAISVLKSEKLSIEREIEESETNIGALNTNLHNLDSRFQEKREEENSLLAQIAAQNQELAVLNEKLKNDNNNIERLRSEIVHSESSLKSYQSLKENTEIRLQEIITIAQTTETELDELKSLRSEAARMVGSRRDLASSANDEVITIQNSINSIRANAKKLESRKYTLHQKIFGAADEISKLENKKSDINSDIQKSLEIKDELAKNIAAAEDDLKQNQEQKAVFQSILDKLNSQIIETKGRLSEKKASLDFLSGLIDPAESSKFLITTPQWQPAGGEKILLGEAIGVDDNLRIAIDAALGWAAGCFVVSSEEDAVQAIDALNISSKGKASFIIKSQIPDTAPPPVINFGEGIIGWASELTRTDNELRNALRLVFGAAVITETMESARAAMNHPEISAAITLKGELIHRHGIIRGGSASKDEGARIGKKERIDSLQGEVNLLKEKLIALNNNYTENKSAFDAIDLKSIEQKIKRDESEAARNRQDIDRLNLQYESINHKISLINENSERFSEELGELEAEAAGAEGEISELDNKLEAARAELESMRAELEAAEENLAERDEAQREAEKASIKLSSERRNLDNEIERNNRLIYQTKNQIEINNSELAKLESEAGLLQQSIESAKKILDTLSMEIAVAKTAREILAAEIASLQEQVEQQSLDLTAKRKNHDKLLENILEKEVKASEIKAQIANLAERAMEQYKFELNRDDIVINAEFSIDENRKAVHAIKDSLTALGNVNFMALEEFDAQSERLKFYTAQVKDLTDSEKTLKETIVEINQTAEEKFLATFKEIQANFSHLFKTLFGREAEGELRLAEGNPLESDIEIIAKPPGKRPHSIEMLSGGEKTLSAIALLFSIYLVKPSPFCILDEVDAPLDDANIGRFIDLLREFSGNTQFLIVTHNKKTMEAADTLYGITMQEIGVSSVVSVRLAPALSA